MGGQIMHTKTDERLVYIIGVIGTLAILGLNLKSGFSIDTILLALKDLSPLMVSILIFKGLFHKPDFKKSANRAIAKIREDYSDIFSKNTVKSEKENAEECLFFAKPQTSFIPLKELREGILEIRVSYGTLANLGKVSPKDTAENEIKIADKKRLVKNKAIATLQACGAKFRVIENKDTAVRIEFEKQSDYDEIIVKVITDIISLLKED